MAYRRKTYKKRFMKRKKNSSFRKRRYSAKGSKRGTLPYTGNSNVECNMTLKMEMAAAFEGVKLAVPWGSSSDALTGYDANQCCDLF